MINEMLISFQAPSLYVAAQRCCYIYAQFLICLGVITSACTVLLCFAHDDTATWSSATKPVFADSTDFGGTELIFWSLASVLTTTPKFFQILCQSCTLCLTLCSGCDPAGRHGYGQRRISVILLV